MWTQSPSNSITSHPPKALLSRKTILPTKTRVRWLSIQLGGQTLELENSQHNVPLRLKQNSMNFYSFIVFFFFNPSVIFNLFYVPDTGRKASQIQNHYRPVEVGNIMEFIFKISTLRL